MPIYQCDCLPKVPHADSIATGNGLVSYYLHNILNSVGIDKPYDQSLFNGGLQIWSFLVALGFSVYFIERLGRRMLFLIAAVGMLVVFSIWTGCVPVCFLWQSLAFS
jgi:hypothetical protein